MPETTAFLNNGGVMGAAMRAHDWSGSPLGLPETWSAPLRIAVSLMLNASESMYLAWGPERVFLFNDAYRPMLGSCLDTALGRPFSAVWADVWDELRPAVEQVFAGTASRFEDRPLTIARYGRDEQTWWTFSFSPVYDACGEVAGLLCVTRETTAHMRAMEAVRRLNASLAMQVEQRTEERDRIWQVNRDMLGVADSDGVWVSINPAWRRVLGWKPEQIIGHTSEWLEHPDDREKTRSEVARLAAGQTTLTFENRFRAQDGDYRVLSWTAVPVEGLLYTVARDVTEDRRREAILKDAQDFARLALSSVGGVGVWTYDAASDQFFCDAAIAELYGLDVERAAAGVSRTEFLGNVHPEDRTPLKATMQSGLARSGTVELEYRLVHPDGTVRSVLSRGITYHDDAGRTVRRTGVGIEVTKQRQLEEQLRQSQKLEAVGQLTGGVAHDFNNLLTVIKSSTDLLKRPDLSEERRTRYIGAISDTVARAARLTGQLLAFARRQALKPEVFDAGRSIKTVCEMIGTLTGSRIEIVTDLPDDACFINADPSQFDTALVNMAVNARDAMDGAGKLTITVHSVEHIPPIRAHQAVQGDYVAICIEDTGTGIAEDRIDRIFEPFFTTKGVGQGTGLGLSQVFGFAKQSGGEVWVQSELGKGTMFVLYLPRVAAVVQVQEPEPEPLMDGHGTFVLVVEDNEDVGSFATQTLAELGYRTFWAKDAEKALAELAQGADRFDVVFTDVIMPGMGGVELAQEISRRQPKLPVVLTSGYSHVLAENGTHGFKLLHKPYSVEELSRILRKATMGQRHKRIAGR